MNKLATEEMTACPSCGDLTFNVGKCSKCKAQLKAAATQKKFSEVKKGERFIGVRGAIYIKTDPFIESEKPDQIRNAVCVSGLGAGYFWSYLSAVDFDVEVLEWDRTGMMKKEAANA